MRILTVFGALAWLALPAAADDFLAGKTISLEGAKKMAEAAGKEAAKHNWNVCIAIVDDGGHLVYFHRMDGTQLASIDLAIGKARTALRFQRPTRLLEEAIAKGRVVLVKLPDATPMQGGLPVVVDGRFVGAIGVSGVTAPEDEVVAQAGIQALLGK